MTQASDKSGWTEGTQSIDKAVIRVGISLEESQNNYQTWGEKGDYDEFMSNADNYYPPRALKEAVESVGPHKDALFLDVGAGTGLSGQVLRDLGYHNLHALEPVSSFCDTLRSKSIYSKIIQEFIGDGQPAEVADDTYDVIVASGSFGPGHIPASALHDMIRLVKPGGYIINCMREEFLETVQDYKDNMVPMMEQMVNDRKWELVSRDTYENHWAGKSGIKLIYKVC